MSRIFRFIAEAANFFHGMFGHGAKQPFSRQSLEDLVGAEVGLNHCQSCCDLLGAQTDCRTLIVEGREYEALPEELLLRAGRVAAERLK